MRFIGNKKIVNFFDLAIKNSSFGQTFCFFGPSKVGKKTLAFNLASQLLKIDKSKLAASPDFHYLEREEDEKTGKKKKDITISQIRELKNKLLEKSWFGGYKVAVIDQAETLNEESGNALLKILEEPPEKSLIFLITEDVDSLLPTILSRAEKFSFSTVDLSEIEDFVLSVGVAKEKSMAIARYSFGAPGRAVDLIDNQDFFEECLKEEKRFEKILSSPVYARWQSMEADMSDKGGQVKTRENIEPLLDLWVLFCREKMLATNDDRYRSIIDEINLTKNSLSLNLNIKLAIEDLLIKI